MIKQVFIKLFLFFWILLLFHTCQRRWKERRLLPLAHRNAERKIYCAFSGLGYVRVWDAGQLEINSPFLLIQLIAQIIKINSVSLWIQWPLPSICQSWIEKLKCACKHSFGDDSCEHGQHSYSSNRIQSGTHAANSFQFVLSSNALFILSVPSSQQHGWWADFM